MRFFLIIVACAGLVACAGNPSGQGVPFQPRPGQGQYVYPDYLRPTPLPYQPAADTCGAAMLQTLVGQHGGAVYIPALPGTKRILKPAFFEGFEDDFGGGSDQEPPLVEVQNYLPGQQIYAPTTQFYDPRDLGPEDATRLTVELDADGYIQEVRCG